MKYSGIIYNDFSAAPGVNLTFFTQGCPHHCKGCHNPETWDFNGGLDFSFKTLKDIDEGLTANNIKRNFCIMGGEPLCEQNLYLTAFLIRYVKKYHPETQVILWTGYTYEQLLSFNNHVVNYIFAMINILVDGPFIENLKDTTLQMRGSSNQKILIFK